MLRLPTQPPARHLVLPILMYHRIDAFSERLPEITRRLTVDPLDFERQMRWLERHGYRTVTQREVFAALIDGRSLGAKPVLITFDDGYRNVLGKAAPVLRHLGFHATAYVITGRISRPDPSFLTWAQLRALERLGIEIGSHTVSHVDLTALSDDMLARELRASRRVLERELGHTVQWLAYPYGAHDQRVVRAARRAGYVLAVTTVRGVSQRATQTLELHRLRVLDDTTIVDLDAMLRDERA